MAEHEDNWEEQEGDGQVAYETEEKVEQPKLYKVLLHNDDYTTMEFVVWVLMEVFQKTQTKANTIMLHVHHKGVGVCGIYPRDIAESKINKTKTLAKDHEMPLMCSMEPE